jgi:hypothetical protein
MGVHPSVVIGKPDSVDCLLWHRWALLANWAEAEAQSKAIQAAKDKHTGGGSGRGYPGADTAPLGLASGGRLPPPPPPPPALEAPPPMRAVNASG